MNARAKRGRSFLSATKTILYTRYIIHINQIKVLLEQQLAVRKRCKKRKANECRAEIRFKKKQLIKKACYLHNH
jgi:hypothetical protein